MLIPILLGMALLLGSCTLPSNSSTDSADLSRFGSGAALLSHRGHIYRLGGKTSAGDYSASVQMATVAADGSLSAWSDETALPSARAYQSVVAYAEYLYLIGGKDASGYLDDVWYTYIYPDGRLGSSWTKSDFTLPEGRAAAAAFILDGRMYLAGGEGSNGLSDQLLSSKIWRDGEPGLWAPEANALPAARMGASALRLGDRVYLAGGKSSSAYLSEVLVARIATDGTLGSWTAGPALPDARAFAALVPYGDYPAILGGEKNLSTATSAYVLGGGSAWERNAALDGNWSGPAVVSRGYACMLKESQYWGQTGDLGMGLVELSKKTAEAPTAKPAGGYVKKNAGIALFAASDETIRYTMATDGVEPADPDASSAIYNDASRPKIAANTILKARSFGTALEASEIARLSFKLSSTSLVYTIERTLGPEASYRECVLQETYSDGSTNPLSSVWYALSVYQRGWYSLSIRDKDDDAAAYTDSVVATLFEGDVLSLLRDSSDGEIDQRPDDLRVYLDAGTYFLRLDSTTAAKGGSFKLRFSEAE
jgi:N-acetylneuraminic acid mutarotase